VIPLALAERLGLSPEVLATLRARDERRKALRSVRAACKAKDAARAAAVYASMPKLRPGAPTRSRWDAEPPRFPSRRTSPLPHTYGVPLTPVDGPRPARVKITPHPPGKPCPSRSSSADSYPSRRQRVSDGSKRMPLADLGILFHDPDHTRRDLQSMRLIVRAVRPLDPQAVAEALERALGLIPLAPSADGLRRRLKRLAEVLVAIGSP
jgi:hypothetical protein